MAGPLHGRTIKPMKAVSGELPVGDDWIYEIKWDGMRIVAFVDADGIRLQTANELNATASFPELGPLAGALDGFHSLILDGEIVAFDDDGRPSFGKLQERMHVKDPVEAARRAKSTPVSYVIFDVLHVDGNDTMSLPFRDRRRLLEQIVEDGPHWRLTDVHTDGATDLLAIVTDRGLEGLIAKRASSQYVEGKRPSTWRKVKPRLRQEFVVGGWAEGRNGRSGSVGSLLVGHHVADGGLRYCGSVGSGLTATSIAEWDALIAEHAVDESPFDGPIVPTAGRRFHWVEPRFVIEVAFGEWTHDGHLRHPSYLGRRFDKDPQHVVREDET